MTCPPASSHRSYVSSQDFISAWLAMSMLGVGMRVTPAALRQLGSELRVVTTSVVANLIALPTLGLILLNLCGATSASFLGIFICLVLGGSTISLKLTASKSANLSLAVLTTASTLVLSALTANLWFALTSQVFSAQAHLDLWALTVDILTNLLSPILLGVMVAVLATRNNPQALGAWPDRIGRLANLLIVGAIWAAVDEPQVLVPITEPLFYLGALFFLGLSLLLPIVLYPATPDRIALLYGSVVRNTALCLVVSRGAGSLAYSGAMIYSMSGVVLGVLMNFGWLWLRRRKLAPSTDAVLDATEAVSD
ncbi:MAG: hypothetical protein MK135_05140 [Polyangiaceae bacterium]|nr:hypothetical protein [Polyangiaceae bacterium]